ncbi:MAG: hypothetical protein QM704_16545 [Anaeromyxobacteraceae bacterium]
MAFHPGATKRQKEAARREKREKKDARREQRKQEKENKGPTDPGVDPDIAGIIPGPQPIPEE